MKKVFIIVLVFSFIVCNASADNSSRIQELETEYLRLNNTQEQLELQLKQVEQRKQQLIGAIQELQRQDAKETEKKLQEPEIKK